MNVFRPLREDHVRFIAVQCLAPDDPGFQFTSAYTFARATDLWAGNIAIPEFYHLNKATQGGGSFQAARGGTSTPHKVDASVIYQLPFGADREYLNSGGHWRRSGKLETELDVHRVFGRAVHRLVEYHLAERAGESTAGRPGEGRRGDLWRVGPTTPYFDVTAFKPVTESALARHVQQPARARSAKLRPELDGSTGHRGRKDAPAEGRYLQRVQQADLCESGQPERLRTCSSIRMGPCAV